MHAISQVLPNWNLSVASASPPVVLGGPADAPRKVRPMSAPALDPVAAFRLDGKVALVTGASAGLGARFARVLHAAGARLVVTARRGDRLEALAAELPGAVPLVADVADADDRERLIASALEACGAIDVLVNNAGVARKVAIEDEALDWFRHALEINTVAVWHLSKLAGAAMVERGSGSIVNVASMLGFVGSTPVKQAAYAASKAAVINLTRELALQWARKGVRVNALCPGWFPSEMTEGMESDEASQRFVQLNSPLPRMGRVEELDGPLLLLASEAGSFMTGTSIVVDGGWLAR
jgi:NAD(P)-dependent dehydrogenase (short-subunit alcohol dehydrogenase family)